MRQLIQTAVLDGLTTTYLVVYRVSTKAEGSLLGDRAARYANLVAKLETLEAEHLSLFEDEGHISTSCWIVRSQNRAAQIGGDLHNVLDKVHDHLAVFAVDDENQWSMRDRSGRTAPVA